jgi:16S rRNA (cytidine1402-2'-O)-methyltransferase
MVDTSHVALGELYLIPNLLGETPVDTSLPPVVASIVSKISHFVVEEEKSARRFIKQLCPDRVIRDLSLTTLNKHTKPSDIDALLLPLREGHAVGVISEAGCPGIADPGAEIVRRAHESGIRVHPLVGPCSMTLALMASGFNGQRWRFLGYLPIDSVQRKETIRAMEREIYESNETQIVMDTPYRNQRLLADLLEACRPETLICIASALTTHQESIQVRSARAWRDLQPNLPKTPALFLLGR